jgi:hypothetical protein
MENGKDDLFERCRNASAKREKLLGLRDVPSGMPSRGSEHEQKESSN